MVPWQQGQPGLDIPQQRVRRVVILGSTGSIGRSALEVISAHRERFEVVALVAGRNAELLAEQVVRFSPKIAVIADGSGEGVVQRAAAKVGCRVETGELAAAEAAAHPDAEVVLAAIVGFAGLPGVLRAVECGKVIALANKESLVCAGEPLRALQQRTGALIIPVDSEHSALFQALLGHRREDLQSLILTASGGPFLRTPIERFATITPAEAVRHPRWNMGPKISVDSATLVNKALELIEARWLFDTPPADIEVVIHPQSIVHSLVRYHDQTQIAQLSVPDMKGAIAYGLTWPEARLCGVMAPLDLTAVGSLEFIALDERRFPAISLARHALQRGGTGPAVFNIANEVAVASFLSGALRFDRIVPLIEQVLERVAARPLLDTRELLPLRDEVTMVARTQCEAWR